MIASLLRDSAAAWLESGREAIVVEVVAARGSVPRGVGTRMLIDAAATAGTIGGGHLELKVIAAARAMIERGERTRREERHALGPSLGQCCGGSVTIALASLDAAALAEWPPAEPLLYLQLHGAGHVGRAIATLLATLDVRVDWFDERDDGFQEATDLGSAWPAHIRRICGDTIEREVQRAPPGAFYLVLTHEHALDERITEAILRRGDFVFCGLIGSQTKRAKFVRRFEARGVAAAAIERLTCPVGIAGIEGKAPEIIAAAVVAQLLRVDGERAGPEVPRAARGAAVERL
ncbi:MAG: xanthine dehydrogenase accessory protein XdhC [Caldimonas sp.]